MNTGKQLKPHLIEKRNEFIWSLHQQGYSCGEIAGIFNISRSRAHVIMQQIPVKWRSPWIKRK